MSDAILKIKLGGEPLGGLIGFIKNTLGIKIGAEVLSPKTVYEFSVKNSRGQEQSMSEYRGKVLLIVNVASQCGFTKQYDGLQKVFTQFADKGLVVLGVPCNQFGGQEPGSAEEIDSFCRVNFGVSFPLAAKSDVKGDDAIPLFKWLTTEANSHHKGDVMWNFEKFLIDRKGALVERWRSNVKPESDTVVKRIEALI